MVLNFGHTLGHAIESYSHQNKNFNSLTHGEAIAIGMAFACKLSLEMERCSEEVVRNITGLIEKLGLPTRLPEFSSEAFIESMYHDKKAQDKNIKFILTRGIGSIEILDRVEESVLKKSLEEFQHQIVGN